jgi:plastocyanin
VLRRLPTVTLPLVAAFAVIALAACSSGSAPGWTYAPAPSASAPSASGAASGAPSGSPAASASAAASVTPSTAPSASAAASASATASGGAVALTVTAPQGAATAGFDPNKLEGPANTPFTVTFDNQDTTTSPHNWVLKDPSGAKVQVGGDTGFFSGPAKREYQIPALAPGDYSFLCEVHPAVMTGTLTIR